MGGWGTTKWQVTAELNNFQGEMAHKEAPLYSNCHTRSMHGLLSSTSRVVVSSKVAACTSQPVAFNGHPTLVDV